MSSWINDWAFLRPFKDNTCYLNILSNILHVLGFKKMLPISTPPHRPPPPRGWPMPGAHTSGPSVAFSSAWKAFPQPSHGRLPHFHWVPIEWPILMGPAPSILFRLMTHSAPSLLSFSGWHTWPFSIACHLPICRGSFVWSASPTTFLRDDKLQDVREFFKKKFWLLMNLRLLE